MFWGRMARVCIRLALKASNGTISQHHKVYRWSVHCPFPVDDFVNKSTKNFYFNEAIINLARSS